MSAVSSLIISGVSLASVPEPVSPVNRFSSPSDCPLVRRSVVSYMERASKHHHPKQPFVSQAVPPEW